MSREFKYVIIDDLYPRICSLAEQHSDLIRYEGVKVTSAGKARLYIEEGKVVVSCYGESVSLNVKSAPGDAALIERLFEEPI